MVDFKRVFEEARGKVLRASGFSLFKKHYSFPSSGGDKSEGTQSADLVGSRANVDHSLPKGSKRRGKKKTARHNGLAASQRDYEISCGGRVLSEGEFNQLREILSNITVTQIPWEKTDESEHVQARLYDCLSNGIVEITNIPKIPCEYEPNNCMYLGLDTEDNSYGYPHFYQIATRESVFIAASVRILMR